MLIMSFLKKEKKNLEEKEFLDFIDKIKEILLS